MPANVETMFYVGKMPWHREGIPLETPPDTAAAIKQAGLDWKVKKVDLYTAESGIIKDFYGVIRSDNHTVLGVVKGGYHPLQNNEAFTFFDPFVKNSHVTYETAGSLGKGEIIWIQAKIKNEGTFKVGKNDEVEKYLLLSNSHDGSSAVSIKFTPVRVVCQNTLIAALGQGDTTRIKHLSSMKEQMQDTQIAMENILRIYRNIEIHFNQMAAFSMKSDKLFEYFNELYPVADKKKILTKRQADQNNLNQKTHERLNEIFESGYGIQGYGLGDTLWAAYNAVTQHVDHPKEYKRGDNQLLKRIWFGEGEVIKKKAYVKALEMISVA